MWRWQLLQRLWIGVGVGGGKGGAVCPGDWGAWMGAEGSFSHSWHHAIGGAMGKQNKHLLEENKNRSLTNWSTTFWSCAGAARCTGAGPSAPPQHHIQCMCDCAELHIQAAPLLAAAQGPAPVPTTATHAVHTASHGAAQSSAPSAGCAQVQPTALVPGPVPHHINTHNGHTIDTWRKRA